MLTVTADALPDIPDDKASGRWGLEISANPDDEAVARALHALLDHLYSPVQGNADDLAVLRTLVPRMGRGTLYKGISIRFMQHGLVEDVFANRPIKLGSNRRQHSIESWSRELETAHAFSLPGPGSIGLIVAARIPLRYRILDLADRAAVDALGRAMDMLDDEVVRMHFMPGPQSPDHARSWFSDTLDMFSNREYEVLVHPDYSARTVYNLCDDVILLTVSRRVAMGIESAPEDRRIRELFAQRTDNMPRNAPVPPFMTFSCDGKGRLRWLSEARLQRFMAARRPKSAIASTEHR